MVKVKISLMEGGKKKSTIIILQFCSLLFTVAEFRAYNYTGWNCFCLVHCRLSRLEDASTAVSCGRKVFLFFPVFVATALLHCVLPFSVSYRYFMHGLTRSHVDCTTHRHPSSHRDAGRKKKKKSYTCMLPLKGVILSFIAVSERAWWKHVL